MTNDIALKKVRIQNFRGIQNLDLDLNESTLLIGQNNAGKTSVISALDLSLGNYSRLLSNEDFYKDELGNFADSIIVDVLIEPTSETTFSPGWIDVFGDSIDTRADDTEYVAIRTTVTKDPLQGFKTERNSIVWDTPTIIKKKRVRFENIFFVNISAQRDIYSDLKDRSSVAYKLLSKVPDGYSVKAVKTIETAIENLNATVKLSSPVLTDLQTDLNTNAISGNGLGVTTISAVETDVKDFARNFTISHGHNVDRIFPTNYHGMGTRSWDSLVSVKTFVEYLSSIFSEKSVEFFPIIAAEEPEAHLHPNAQRSIFDLLNKIECQSIISSHSPYVLGSCELQNVTKLVNDGTNVLASKFGQHADANSINNTIFKWFKTSLVS
jgi:putative ATP-dependent endonuclease of OLD family